MVYGEKLPVLISKIPSGFLLILRPKHSKASPMIRAQFSIIRVFVEWYFDGTLASLNPEIKINKCSWTTNDGFEF